MFIDSNNLNNEDLDKKELEFRQLVADVPKEESLRVELKNFFRERQNGERQFRYSYWRWYVWVNWDLLHALDEDEFINIAVGKQIPMAILLDFPVLKDILRYLSTQTYTDVSTQSLYVKIKKAFIESQAIVGVWQGKEMYVSDLVKEIISMSTRDNSLEQAEFQAKLRSIMFSNDAMAEKYAIVNPDVGVERFIELALFFNRVMEDNISLAVDDFINPNKYKMLSDLESRNQSEGSLVGTLEKQTEQEVEDVEKDEALEEEGSESLTSLPQNLASKYESMSQKLDAEIKASENVASSVAPVVKAEPEKPAVAKSDTQATEKEVPAKSSSVQTPSVEPPKPARLTAGEIKSQIESEFKQDLEGNFVDIEGVMRKLEEFAEIYNDSKIADLIYFDEDDNKFKWKV